MSKNEQKIRRLLAAKNYPNDLIQVSWEPITKGIEMGGIEGGWIVEIKGFDYIFGFNICEVIESIEELEEYDHQWLEKI